MHDDSLKRGGDRVRWGDRGSYREAWASRAEIAAKLVPDRTSILEIGVGLGAFRALVADRCNYLGADLVPLDKETLAIDLELDPLPPGTFDVVVLLGVLEYVSMPEFALAKIFASGRSVLLSYCHVGENASQDVVAVRRARGWLNDLSSQTLGAIAERHGFQLRSDTHVNETPDFVQSIFLFERTATAHDASSV